VIFSYHVSELMQA